MYHQVQFSKKINIKNQYSSRLSITDFFVIIAAGGVPWLAFSHLFPAVLQLLPAILGAVIAYILVSPSGIPEKKTYQVIWLVIRKPRRIYHSIDNPRWVRLFKEDDRHGV
ncbi:DUF5592 family protein [Lacticaseibacillus suilingensis]|jgi:hypothetical protein|uniref:DUF5592 family protein n=1 Tax=Lacticaseibacillus suilingensis TaxID=2799577 RepID=A0ABW4BJG7_9LACO|nr:MULTISPECIES: DUF5592 family protein [Lacticaseibacillus]